MLPRGRGPGMLQQEGDILMKLIVVTIKTTTIMSFSGKEGV